MGRIPNIFIAVLFLCVPLTLFYVQKRAPELPNAFRKAAMGYVYAAEDRLLGVASSVSDRLYEAAAAFDAQKEVIRLRSKADDVRALRVAVSELLGENQRLKALMQFAQTIDAPRIIGARVIGRMGTPAARTIQIDQGSSQGVTRGDAVITSAGVVGQVLMTAPNYSSVLLVNDPASAVDVVVQKSRAHGIVRGTPSAKGYRLKVSDFDRLHHVEVGDVIVTSGVGARFPVGVPVGEVTALREPKDGVYIEADVHPFTQFDTLEEVLVLTRGGPAHPYRGSELIMEEIEQSVGANKAKKEGDA